ncbi:MAG: LON peptidase substrate-binding domain-containing protein [Proteobacteria bacterium]|nr:LON peptidase substrate-binding domain-containing protein [Pseudomonadota bacterium]
MQPQPLPLFPLNCVLFPGGPLALRVFEPRYLGLVRDCLRGGSEFGVVLILSGTEAGAVEALAPLGTTARIVDFDALPGGLLGIRCRGGRRFHLLGRHSQPDGLYVGDVEYLPVGLHQPLPQQYAWLTEQLQPVLAKLAAVYGEVRAGDFSDAAWVANRWTELLPLDNGARLALLGIADPLQRLERIAALVRGGN